MGSWGFKAFDSDSAGDFMVGVQSLLLKPINKVIKARSDASASDYYDRARAASMSLLALSKATNQVEQESLVDAVHALDRMRNDDQWVGAYTKPAEVRKSLNKDVRLLVEEIGVMRKRWRRILQAEK